MQNTVAVIILAAGKGTRMNTELPKCAISTCDKPMIVHVTETAASLSPEKIVLVTGYKKEIIENAVAQSEIPNKDKILFAPQMEQLGTGDAVKAAIPSLENFKGTVLILYGDTPLISTKTLNEFLATHAQHKNSVSILTVLADESATYGRIIRDDKNGEITKIVELKDCSPEQKRITEMNSGIYAVESSFLSGAIGKLTNNNAQKEYYLTDIVESAFEARLKIGSLAIQSNEELQGVNDLFELSLVNQNIQRNRTKSLLKNGVFIEDPSSIFIEGSVQIASGARIGPNTQLRGKTTIAGNVVIDGTAYILDSTIGENSHIKLGSYIEGATIGKKCLIGPFAHIRPESILDDEVKVGNFVETKKSHLHRGVKASHLTYLGDAEIGEDTNIGAGTITCNYDGYKKFKTSIGKNVFIGSNSALVAPIVIEDGATVGAGSTITQKVEKDSLALTRAPQVVKEEWSKKKRELNKSKI